MDIVEHDQQRLVGRRLQQHGQAALDDAPAPRVGTEASPTGDRTPTHTVGPPRRTEFGDRRRDTMQHGDGSKFIC